jgi:hypothetical protein
MDTFYVITKTTYGERVPLFINAEVKLPAATLGNSSTTLKVINSETAEPHNRGKTKYKNKKNINDEPANSGMDTRNGAGSRTRSDAVTTSVLPIKIRRNRIAERAVAGSYLRFLWMPTIVETGKVSPSNKSFCTCVSPPQLIPYRARCFVDLLPARAAYQDFLTLWKDADPDIPLLKDAEVEYANLR